MSVQSVVARPLTVTIRPYVRILTVPARSPHDGQNALKLFAIANRPGGTSQAKLRAARVADVGRRYRPLHGVSSLSWPGFAGVP